MSGNAEQSETRSRWVTPIELTLLGAIWGASFLFMRIAAGDFGPFALVEVRLSLGALVLLPFLWRSRTSFAPLAIWRLAGIGIINSAIPFVLLADHQAKQPIRAVNRQSPVVSEQGKQTCVQRCIGLEALRRRRNSWSQRQARQSQLEDAHAFLR